MPQPANPSSFVPSGPAEGGRGNSGYVWDDFEAEAYAQANYARLRDDDRYLLTETAGFLARSLSPSTSRARRLTGVDVGTGANLYPALAMLPFCREIDLWERGGRNTRWLTSEVRSYSAIWDDYWDVLADRRPYRAHGDPRAGLSRTARVCHADLFRLPRHTWDVGTMFFIAESISDRRSEFELAIARFVGGLRPGAPFAAAFMRDSHGYPVGDKWFPSVAVREPDVEDCLAPLSRGLRVSTVETDEPLRDGYSGMILALGVAGA